MSRAIGIDLGTTYSAVAVLREGGDVEVLTNRDGEHLTPSVVLFQPFTDRDEPLVGTMATLSAMGAPDDVAQFVKRNIGDPSWRYSSTSGATYSGEEVSAMIIRRLKQDAELALGEPVTNAVITVPAYFDDARRTATRHAGTIAGLNVLRVLNEPTAAALSFGLDTLADGTVLVYDLGGGTFDVTVMRIGGGEFDVLATDGDRNLGGFDFDNRMIEYLAGMVQDQGGPDLLENSAEIFALREKAEMVKRSLTTADRTPVLLSARDRSYRVMVERSEFERLTTDLLNRTRDLTNHVVRQAGLSWAQLDHVILVGGSTRMPMVRALVDRLARRSVARVVDPDEAVARGAAIQAAMEHSGPGGADLFGGSIPVISDVTSQSLGIIQFDDGLAADINTIVIPHNSTIPAKLSVDGRTIVDNQASITVVVTEGDETDPEYVVTIGSLDITLPPCPKGSPVRVTYAYDVDQTVFVEVTDLTTSHSLGTFTLDRVANLTDVQVRAATATLSSLAIR